VSADYHLTLGVDSESILRGFLRLQVTLADQQADPNSPLYSAKTFEQLGL
jgi:ATP-dependent RNA helicase DDX19/DBP5